jgi:hypothetical protein
MGNGTGGFGRVRAGASGGISFTARMRGFGREVKIIGGLICRTRIGDLAMIWWIVGDGDGVREVGWFGGEEFIGADLRAVPIIISGRSGDLGGGCGRRT